MWPVWIMKGGFAGNALILLTASSSVPSALGLAGLSKPTWLSLIWRKGMPGACAAIAESTMPSERGTPPVIVQSTPVPAQVMHSSTLRRLTPSSPWSCPLIAHLLRPGIGLRGGDWGRGGFIPGCDDDFVRGCPGAAQRAFAARRRAGTHCRNLDPGSAALH